MIGVLCVNVLAACLGACGDDGASLTMMESGLTKKLGYYAPLRLTLSDQKPASLTKLPEGLEAPLYGTLPTLGGDKFHVVIDEPEGKPARLFVDSNGNGDLTDDPAAEWKAGDAGETPDGKKLVMMSGSMTIRLGEGRNVTINAYRFDKHDPRRAALASTLLFYPDYAEEGKATIGGKEYSVMLLDRGATGDFRGKTVDGADENASSGISITIDRNANGKIDTRGEEYDAGKPFTIDGVTYEIRDMAQDGHAFKVVKSDKTVPEISLPPDHSVGKKVTAFTAPLFESGKEVKFPQDYKGKVVMLDFWATWCGPCMGEVPGLVAAYKKYHPRGFEVLGVSLDQKDQGEKLKKVTGEKGMTWPQVYDGGYWKARIAEMYVIQSIPAAYLVDGDTGEILASGGSLRGAKLDETIEKALKEKSKN